MTNLVDQFYKFAMSNFTIARAQIADKQLEDKLQILNNLFDVTRSSAYDICYDDGIIYSWKIPDVKLVISKLFETFGEDTKDHKNGNCDIVWTFPTDNKFNYTEIGVTINDDDSVDLMLISCIDEEDLYNTITNYYCQFNTLNEDSSAFHSDHDTYLNYNNIANLVNEFYKKAESCQVGHSCGGADQAFNFEQWAMQHKAVVQSAISVLEPEQSSMLYGTPNHLEKSWLLFVLKQMVNHEQVDLNDKKLALSDWRLNYANNERITSAINGDTLYSAIMSYRS